MRRHGDDGAGRVTGEQQVAAAAEHPDIRVREGGHEARVPLGQQVNGGNTDQGAARRIAQGELGDKGVALELEQDFPLSGGRRCFFIHS